MPRIPVPSALFGDSDRAALGVLTISIISHGHGMQVARLLMQLGRLPYAVLANVMLTVNAPRLDAGIVYADSPLAARLNLKLIRNAAPLGFSANHNQAFAHCTSRYFCVMNPDIELPDALAAIQGLLTALAPVRVGLAYPLQVDTQGEALDFARELVMPASLFKRYINGERFFNAKADAPADWVSGSLMVFKSSVYAQLGGFDERYFLYCEDVDICLRTQLAGYTMERSSAVVVHDTQRRTLKSARHLAWHVRSLWRLWRSQAYADYLKFVAKKM